MKLKIILSLFFALLIFLILVNIYLHKSIPWDKYLPLEQKQIRSELYADHRLAIILLFLILLIPAISFISHMDNSSPMSRHKLFPPLAIIAIVLLIAAAATAAIWDVAWLKVTEVLQTYTAGMDGFFTAFVLFPICSLGLLTIHFLAWVVALLGLAWNVLPKDTK